LSIDDLVRERGPMTVAAFMDLALYDPSLGYYARASRRSGRAGDFFTSVDVGPLFGELLERQLFEMAGLLDATRLPASSPGATGDEVAGPTTIDLVEAGAGNGRLSADILHAAGARHPGFPGRIRLHLVETSLEARAAHSATLGDLAVHIASSADALPESFEGILVANELLDAFPVHQVVMCDDGLREVYVAAVDGRLQTIEGPPSTPALEDYLTRLGVALEPGWRVEINLRAVDWIRQAVRRLRRGFIILIDYGHEARELYSPTHSSGTLTTFARHTMAGPEARRPRVPAWLDRPGEQDITAHVDFTSVRRAAEGEGAETLGFLDQTYFVLGLITDVSDPNRYAGIDHLKQGLALKTLMMPGGLGSTHKVIIFGKGVGRPALRGCSFGQRVT
jgi:SAM-dependent MidA family methyltransferase